MFKEKIFKSVEAVPTALHLGEQLALAVPDPAAVDQHLAATLVQLANADDVALKLGDVVHICQCLVLTGLALEHDRAAPPDVDAGVVAELHRADDAGVELEEGLALPDHVVARTGVQVPQLLCSIPFSPRLIRACFVEYDAQALVF